MHFITSLSETVINGQMLSESRGIANEVQTSPIELLSCPCQSLCPQGCVSACVCSCESATGLSASAMAPNLLSPRTNFRQLGQKSESLGLSAGRRPSLGVEFSECPGNWSVFHLVMTGRNVLVRGLLNEKFLEDLSGAKLGLKSLCCLLISVEEVCE